MKILTDNLKSQLITDNPKLIEKLSNLYKFRVEGYRYSPAYKRRQWDGYKRFISNTGIFSTGLMNLILDDLRGIGADPEIVHKYTPESVDKVDVEEFTYYDFQDELIVKALDKRRCIVKSPTGSGKTLIMAGIVAALDGKTMTILFNSKQLLVQTHDFLEKCGIEGLGYCFGDGFKRAPIMLSTVHSIKKIQDWVDDCEVLMVDEAHEFSKGDRNLKAISGSPKAQWRFGFTATPPTNKLDYHALVAALGSVVETVSVTDLIEDGFLTKPIIQMIKRSYDASGEDEELSYLDGYEKFIVNNAERNNIIKECVSLILEQRHDAKIMILTKFLSHGENLLGILGGNTYYIDGSDGLAERYEAIGKFTEPGVPCTLIGTRILQTGIDITEITHFIVARGGQSVIGTIQAIGRALRKDPTKEFVYIYDFIDPEKYLVDHSNKRKNTYKKQGHEVNFIHGNQITKRNQV